MQRLLSLRLFADFHDFKGVFILKNKLSKIDSVVLDAVTKLHSKTNNVLVHLITMLGNAGVIWWIMSVPFFITRHYRYIGFNILVAMLFGWLIGEVIIKNIVGRTRPSELLEQDELIIKPRHSSFPSGHTTTSFAVAMALILNCRIIIWLPGLVIAALISFSRMYLRVHYCTDVCGGIAIGLCCGVLSKFATEAVRLIPIMEIILG